MHDAKAICYDAGTSVLAGPRMIDVDIEWMPPEARKEFRLAVEAFLVAVRCGYVGQYQTGQHHMRNAGQIVIRSGTPSNCEDLRCKVST